MTSAAVEVVRTALRACVIAFVLSGAWLRVLLRRSSAEEAVYRAAVRLGPTAIKLAQVASTRPDLVSPSVSRRLESLQEAAPRFSSDEAREVVREDLGAAIEALFREFPVEPIASASLSQVYFATLDDGKDVAVKVQRPGIEPRIRRDVRILRVVARLVTLLRPSLRNLRLADAAEEFGRWTLRELDFRLEAANADEFRQNFAEWPDVHLPVIHWAHTSRRVLTMERVGGRRAKNMLSVLDDDARMDLVRHLADMIMKMFVDDGLFHADLHPGNVFFQPDARIILLDMGMVGRMNRGQADRFLAYWMAVGRRQRDRAFHHLQGLAVHPGRGDIDGYRREYERILDAFDGSSVTEKSLAHTYFDVVQSGARHGVVFPSEMLLQAKALVTMEALCLVMAPEFRFSEEMRPIVARRLAERASPKALLERMWEMLPDFVVAGEWFPTERHSRDREAEPAFRRDALVALTASWSDATDAWLSNGARLPDATDQPHFAALLEFLVQTASLVMPSDGHDDRHTGVPAPHAADGNAATLERWAAFRRTSRLGASSAEREGPASWHRERPWLDAGSSAFLPLARVALARVDAALREHVERAPASSTTDLSVVAVTGTPGR